MVRRALQDNKSSSSLQFALSSDMEYMDYLDMEIVSGNYKIYFKSLNASYMHTYTYVLISLLNAGYCWIKDEMNIQMYFKMQIFEMKIVALKKVCVIKAYILLVSWLVNDDNYHLPLLEHQQSRTSRLYFLYI